MMRRLAGVRRSCVFLPALLASAGLLALPLAGLLLVSYDADQYYEIFDCLLRADQRGQLDRRLLGDSHRRLAQLFAGFVRKPLYSRRLAALW